MKTDGPILTKDVKELRARKDDVAAVRSLVNDERSSISPSSPVWMQVLESLILYPFVHSEQIPFFSTSSYASQTTQLISVH